MQFRRRKKGRYWTTKKTRESASRKALKSEAFSVYWARRGLGNMYVLSYCVLSSTSVRVVCVGRPTDVVKLGSVVCLVFNVSLYLQI